MLLNALSDRPTSCVARWIRYTKRWTFWKNTGWRDVGAAVLANRRWKLTQSGRVLRGSSGTVV